MLCLPFNLTSTALIIRVYTVKTTVDAEIKLEQAMQTVIRFHYTAQENDHKHRLDVVLARELPAYSRGQIQQWIKTGQVTINGTAIQKPKQPILRNDVITLSAKPKVQTTAQPDAIPLDIVFEDAQLLVINKPVGLVTHPGAGNLTHTLLNALLHHAPSLSQLPRAGIVHRLDKDTSGLLVVAKTLTAHQRLIKQMQARKIKREYLALVCGKVIAGGSIDAPIGRHPSKRTKMAVTHNGKVALTHYRVAAALSPTHTLLSVTLETGRTHQIRVHLAHIGYPIEGDRLYARKRTYPGLNAAAQTALTTFQHQALHALRLSLTHPETGEWLSWEASLPSDFSALLVALKKQ